MAKEYSNLNPFYIISWIFKIATLLSFVWLYNIGKPTWAYNALAMFILIIIPDILAYHHKTRVPLLFNFLLSSAIGVHVLGFSLSFYPNVPNYDILTHLLSIFLVGYMAFVTLLILTKNTNKLKISLRLIAIFTIAICMASGVLWEIYEYVADVFIFGSPHEQWSVADTMKDLIINTIGAFIISVAMGKWIRSLSPAELRKKLDHPILTRFLRRRL